MKPSKAKSIEYCLDKTLHQLYHNWTPTDRKPIAGEDLLCECGLPIRHEYFITLIQKLISDGYVMLTDHNHPEDVSLMDTYQRRSIITIDGQYFVEQKKSYRRNKRWSKVKNLFTTASLIFGSLAFIWQIVEWWLSKPK